MLKFLKVVRVVWIALGAIAAGYVVFFYKKSAWPVALVFLAVYVPVEMIIRRLEKAAGLTPPPAAPADDAADADGNADADSDEDRFDLQQDEEDGQAPAGE